MASERIVLANGVDLCVETFGELSWEDDFCERLAAGSRFVIRYYNRDAGRSVTYEPGAPNYAGPALVDDAVGILDALGIDRAHVVGLSMGGGIGQFLAVRVPSLPSRNPLNSGFSCRWCIAQCEHPAW